MTHLQTELQEKAEEITALRTEVDITQQRLDHKQLVMVRHRKYEENLKAKLRAAAHDRRVEADSLRQSVAETRDILTQQEVINTAHIDLSLHIIHICVVAV